MPELDKKTAARILFLLNPRCLYHRAEIEHADRLPTSGGAVIVSNHGRLDFDCFVLIGLILRERGRLVRLLADHLWFRIPGVGRIWSLAGAIDGTRRNAALIVDGRELVLTYPGGVREVMNNHFGHEEIDWSGHIGFAEVAIAAGVPVVPIVGVGVNNGFLFLTRGELLGRLLFRRILRLGPAYDKYRNPLTVGLFPVPLPFSLAVHLPLPCKVRYVVGEPIYPLAASCHPVADSPDSDGAAPDLAGEGGGGCGEDAAGFAARVVEEMRSLIAQHGRP